MTDTTKKGERFLIQRSEGIDHHLDERAFAEASVLGFVEAPQSPTAHIVAKEKARAALGMDQFFFLSWKLASDIEKSVAEQHGEIKTE